jgi:hypothetical protein
MRLMSRYMTHKFVQVSPGWVEYREVPNVPRLLEDAVIVVTVLIVVMGLWPDGWIRFG